MATAIQLLAGASRVWLKPELRIRIATLSALAGQGASGALRSSQDRQRAWVADRMEQMGFVRWSSWLISVPPLPPQRPDVHQQHSCHGESKGLVGLKTAFEQSSHSQRCSQDLDGRCKLPSLLSIPD